MQRRTTHAAGSFGSFLVSWLSGFVVGNGHSGNAPFPSKQIRHMPCKCFAKPAFQSYGLFETLNFRNWTVMWHKVATKVLRKVMDEHEEGQKMME
jgi:hypothetical protein